MTTGIRVAFGGGGEAEDERRVLDLFGSWVGDGRLLYVPIAMAPPYEACLEWVTAALDSSGIANIAMATSSEQVVSELPRSDAVFIGGGNTYSLLHALRANEADRLLRRTAEGGCPVYGGSAGAILLGRDIDTSKHADPNDVGLTDTSGLDLALGYAVWCHHVRGDDSRIRDFVAATSHEVIAIPERGGLARIGDTISVVGPGPAKVFGPSGSRSFEAGDLVPAAAALR